jgi:plastocyanin
MTRLHSLSVAAIILAALSLGDIVAADEWGTIKGKFVFGGAPPSAGELKADKDPEVCGKHKLLAEELVVGADKGIANVVVFVRDKDVKINPEAAKAAAAKVTLDNKDCRFEPHVAFVQVGQDLVVKNSDTVGHNSNIATVKNPPSNNLIPAGGEAAIKFTSDEAMKFFSTWKSDKSPRGPISIDPVERDIVQNVYIRRGEMKNGKLVNIDIDTIPDVKDPWKVLNPAKK